MKASLLSFAAAFAAVTLCHAQPEQEVRVELNAPAIVPVHPVEVKHTDRVVLSPQPARAPKTVRMAQATPTPPGVPPVDAAAIADWATDVAMVTSRGALEGVFGGRSMRRPVVVGADTKNIAKLEKDLTIMARILEKAAGSKEEGAKAMGIDVFSFGSSSSAPRQFYLADYGALFVLRVRFPLLAPPKDDDQTRTNETTSSEWERARQELYGGRQVIEELKLAFKDGATEEFDSEKVESFRSQIIDDLANATHIEGLKSDEYVTVVVLGAAPRSGPVITRTESRSSGSARAAARADAARAASEGANQSTLTLRAKKSDIDAFAKGKLKGEEFRKKVSVQVY